MRFGWPLGRPPPPAGARCAGCGRVMRDGMERLIVHGVVFHPECARYRPGGRPGR